MIGNKTKLMRKSIINHIVVYGALIIMLLPYIYMVISSFKTRLDIYAYPPKFIFTPTLDNYLRIFSEYNLGPLFRNSLLIAIFNVPLVILVAYPAAYSYARMRPKLSDLITFLLLFMQLVPPISIVFAFFNLARIFTLIDKISLLVIVNLLWGIPYSVWMLKDFIAEIPIELEEAAFVDGASLLGTILKITLPLSMRGIMTTAIMVFIHVWNEFVFAFFLTQVNAKTLPTVIQYFLAYGDTEWGYMFAAAALSTLPAVIFGIAVKKYFVRGQTYGAVKG